MKLFGFLALVLYALCMLRMGLTVADNVHKERQDEERRKQEQERREREHDEMMANVKRLMEEKSS